jgi:hypothetical protein
MKSILQKTGTGVTVFAILALALWVPGTAGSKTELPEISQSLRPTVNSTRSSVPSKAISKLRLDFRKSSRSGKQRLAAMAYVWYVMTSKKHY